MNAQAENHVLDELRKLEEARAAENTADRRMTRVTLGLSALIGIIVLGFLFVNYLYFNKEWTEEKFAKSFNRELEELQPIASRELQSFGKKLVPVFVQESRRQFPEIAPLLSNKINEELKEFSNDFQKDINAKMNRTGDRLKARLLEDIIASYPNLRGENAQQKMIQRFRESTHAALQGSIGHFMKRFSTEVDNFQDTVFNVPESDTPMVELQKKLIRLWLQLLDGEIARL